MLLSTTAALDASALAMIITQKSAASRPRSPFISDIKSTILQIVLGDVKVVRGSAKNALKRTYGVKSKAKW